MNSVAREGGAANGYFMGGVVMFKLIVLLAPLHVQNGQTCAICKLQDCPTGLGSHLAQVGKPVQYSPNLLQDCRNGFGGNLAQVPRFVKY